MHFDLIVIGMGLSGLMAAKTAAEMGKKVLIVGKGLGALSILSNTIDVLGILPETVKMKDGLSQWIEEHPEHPYGKVGLEKIWEALSSFNSFFPPPYAFQSRNETNSLASHRRGNASTDLPDPIHHDERDRSQREEGSRYRIQRIQGFLCSPIGGFV